MSKSEHQCLISDNSISDQTLASQIGQHQTLVSKIVL